MEGGDILVVESFDYRFLDGIGRPQTITFGREHRSDSGKSGSENLERLFAFDPLVDYRSHAIERKEKEFVQRFGRRRRWQGTRARARAPEVRSSRKSVRCSR